jgi:hypothetical protein
MDDGWGWISDGILPHLTRFIGLEIKAWSQRVRYASLHGVQMVLLLIVCILVVAVYGVYLTVMLQKRVAAVTGLVEAELKEIRSLVGGTKDDGPSLKTPTLAHDWFDDWFDFRWVKSDEEENAPIENPTPQTNPDEYLVQIWIAGYQSFPNPQERRDFVRRLIWSGASIEKPEFLDVVFGDESPYVRAWAAAHLQTVIKDYSTECADPRNRPDIRNYDTTLLSDPCPIVRAALWSNPLWKNPQIDRLPWGKIPVDWPMPENWKERFRGLSYLERLGLMRNPELSKHFVVAVMETPTEELNISRVEHAEVLVAAAMNPALIRSSRLSGRKWWVVDSYPNSPFEEFGKMWELSVSHWMDQHRVPYFFLKFIQTTPKMKSAIYQALLAKARGEESDTGLMVLREALIGSCDPMEDSEVLKLAWTDPSEVCRKALKGRLGSYDIGKYASFLGVNQDGINNV